MRIGICLDSWKVPIFEEALTEAGYEFKVTEGITHDTKFMQIEVEDVPPLEILILETNALASSTLGGAA